MSDGIVLEHPDARVKVEDVDNGLREVTVLPHGHPDSSGTRKFTTGYPVELIERILDVRGPVWLHDDIARDEDRRYVERYLRPALLAYVSEATFAGKRILDFGCGSGASTVILARLFPDSEIVGVELMAQFVDIARLRARHYGLTHVTFHVSEAPDRLPDGLGNFDFVMLSAVFEHLLPDERLPLLGQTWSLLRPGGILFLNQTPYRWFPYEHHTTGLPLLNYLPDRLAHAAARRFSRRVEPGVSWDELLRRGVRGGTGREVFRLLRQVGGGVPELLRPSRLGMRDRVDIWYTHSMAGRRPMRVKRLLRRAFKAVGRVTGEDFTPSIALAIRKR